MTEKKANDWIWGEFGDIDPKFTKPITGKQYNGISPNPHHIIHLMTKAFGPVGSGFGWKILREDFQSFGDTTVHWCRIEFWWTEGEQKNSFEQYGQTKAAYTTSGGKFMVDEDAPKKSLTDAITKASAQLGFASSIFLGRWDDSKYVAELREEFSDTPKTDFVALRDRLKEKIAKCKSTDELTALWNDDKQQFAALANGDAPKYNEVKAAFSERGKKVNPAPQTPKPIVTDGTLGDALAANETAYQ